MGRAPTSRIGSPIAGRSDAALDELVGFFVNTLVLRTDTSGNPRFRELLGRVRGGNLAAYGHADLPFERLVEVLNPARSLSRHPLFQVMLAFEAGAGARRARSCPGLRCGREPVATASAKFDLSVGLVERRAADGAPAGIDGVLEYASDLFDAASVATLGERLMRLLAGGGGRSRSRARQPDDPGGRRARHHPAALERHRAARCGRATLPELFAAQAARTPEAAAVMFEDRVLSYAELDAHANRLAHHLRSLGVGPETWSGSCAERSLEMVVGLLGILKAGGAYLPLDPDYPRERLADMVADAGLGVVLLQGALAALPAAAGGGVRRPCSTVRRSAGRAPALRRR